MTGRTTRLAAAGLLVIVLPFAGTTEASAHSRAETGRVHGRLADGALLLDAVGTTPRSVPGQTLTAPTGTYVANTLTWDVAGPSDGPVHDALQADIQDAVDSASLAVSRARLALDQVAMARDVVTRRFAATELADAEVGLAASVAQLRYVVELVSDAGSPDAVEALGALTAGVAQLRQAVTDVTV